MQCAATTMAPCRSGLSFNASIARRYKSANSSLCCASASKRRHRRASHKLPVAPDDPRWDGFEASATVCLPLLRSIVDLDRTGADPGPRDFSVAFEAPAWVSHRSPRAWEDRGRLQFPPIDARPAITWRSPACVLLCAVSHRRFGGRRPGEAQLRSEGAAHSPVSVANAASVAAGGPSEADMIDSAAFRVRSSAVGQRCA